MHIQDLWFAMSPNYRISLVISLSISNLVFIGWCCIADSNASGDGKPYYAFSRMVARHVKLAVKLVFGSLLLIMGLWMILAMQKKSHEGTGNGGPETEHLAGFVNRVTLPAQYVVDGFIGLLGLIAILICAGLIGLAHSIETHPLPYLIGAIWLYLLWLRYTMSTVVKEETDYYYADPCHMAERTRPLWIAAAFGSVAGLFVTAILALTTLFAMAATVQGISSYIDAH